jgi:protein-histidine pros-kinase
MGLRTKFNLLMLLVFLVGLAGAGLVMDAVIVRDARDEVLENARLMLEAANAIRGYTARRIQPLLAEQNKETFLPVTVPSFAAQTNFKTVQANYPEYVYREPALNPTNLNDRASDWEADLINTFRNDVHLPELVSERETPTGRALILARPIQIKDPQCLVCHSTPEAAPPAMTRVYGTANGFHWNKDEIIGAQVVSVPLSLALQNAHRTLIVYLAILVAVFLVMMALVNILLHYTVIRPVVKTSKIAERVSLGDLDAEHYEKKGKDEIASLTTSFARMRRSLELALAIETEPSATGSMKGLMQ